MIEQAVQRVADGIRQDSIGGTVSTKGLSLPLDGYWVGGVTDTLIAPQGASGSALLESLRVLASGADWLGFWAHSGRVYVDATSWHPTLDEALRFGRVRGEIAIWDIANDAEIKVEGQS